MSISQIDAAVCTCSLGEGSYCLKARGTACAFQICVPLLETRFPAFALPFTPTPFCGQRPMYVEGNEPRLADFAH